MLGRRLLPRLTPPTSAGSTSIRRRAVAALAAVGAVAGTLVAAASVGAPAAAAATPSRVVSAWLPYWDITAATQSVTANQDLFNEASPFWFQSSAVTTVAIKSGATAAGLQSLVSTLHAEHIKVVPTVTDGMSASYSATFMSDPSQIAQHVNTLMSLVTTYNLDGLDMDYENIAFSSNATIAPQIRAGYVALLTALAARLHAVGKELTVAVIAKTQEGTSPASQAYNYAAIGAVADKVRVMTYDQHSTNTAYPGGAVAGVQWVNAVMQYAVSVIPSTKVEMGVPLYGYDYSSAGGASAVSYTQVSNLMAQYHATRQWSATDGSPYFTYTAADGSQHTVWYDDAGSLAARLPLVAKYNLAGIVFWSLGDEDPGIWNVVRSYTYGPNPFGILDSVAAVPGGAQISGWTIDANTTDPIRVDIYSNNKGVQSTQANVNRADINSLYVVYGGDHGFNTTVALPAGNNNVCAYAINVGDGGNTLLGCRTVTVLSGSPFGSFDSAAPAGPGQIAVRGWSIDPDTANATRVDFYVDGKGAASLQATAGRADVAKLYPGYGAAHGFGTTLSASGGKHQVCAFAINTAGPGSNTLLACRTVTLPTGSPVGSIDAVSAPGPGQIAVRGWSLDPDTTAATRVDVYVDGKGVTSLQASNNRPDIASAFPGYGAAHGFGATLNVAGGKHQVCLFAINIAAGGNTLLGCRTLTMPSGSPFGSLDSVTATGSGQIAVQGWAIDPDTISPIRVDFYVDGKGAASTQANVTRSDLATAFPGYGAGHGFDTTISGLAPGQHQLCAYAINVGLGAANTKIGCQAVTTQ